MRVAPLTLEHAYQVAEHMCTPHRSDVLRDYTSVWQWARSRVDEGVAWACIADRPVWACGVVSAGQAGMLWLAGVEGWTRYVKHAIRVGRAIFASGSYRHYACEVDESDPVARRFAERLGFRALEAKDGFVLYGVTP
jgi:hypothetical protein